MSGFEGGLSDMAWGQLGKGMKDFSGSDRGGRSGRPYSLHLPLKKDITQQNVPPVSSIYSINFENFQPFVQVKVMEEVDQ